jgi:hypothetical protein
VWAQQATDGAPLVLEIHGGWGDPIGYGGLALVYDPGQLFSAGVGLGFDASPAYSLPALGVFGRMRVLHYGPVALGMAVTMSRGHSATTRTYDRPPAEHYYTDTMRWTWDPAYRATAALAAELAGNRWSLRLEVGAAFLLNNPKCTYNDGYTGDCNSPEVPEPYHFTIEPGRVTPSVTATVGYRFGARDPGSENAAPVDNAYRFPNTALQLSVFSTLGLSALGTGFLILNEKDGHHGDWMQVTGIAALVLGLAVGPSVGHIYAGEDGHAAGMALGRVSAAGVGLVLLVSALANMGDCESCSNSLGPGMVPALLLGLAIPISIIYDLVDAPRAARRSNTRHGLTNLSLAPVVIPGRTLPGHGLALTGQF